MHCSACGTDNPDGARFCNGCGTSLRVACNGCGHSNPPTSRFCNACGDALIVSAASNASSPRSEHGSPRSYTPRHLAAKIMAGRDALAGERKQVTVLFADVVGSTELIQGRDPEESQRLLDGVVQVMMKAVHRYEGTVSRLMGDGLMAMFGAPVAHEDHALRACYAALAMLEAARDHAEEVRQAQGATIQIRIGLNSGDVVVRLISDDLHMDYTAMGETVHLASRMEGLAEAGTALLAPTTAALAEGYVQVRALGPTPVRGLAEPVEAYLLVGAAEVRTRFQASAARGLTQLVGRQHEVGTIEAALTQAGAGHGQVVALVGEPGVGKSRLVYEVAHGASADGWLVLQSRSASYGKATPYLPIIDLLRGYGRIESGDDAGTIRRRLSDRLVTLDPSLLPIVPPLLSLLDVTVEDTSWTALDPASRRRAILDAVRRLMLRESQRQPLLLVCEDLHWVDEQTQALLDSLVDLLPNARTLLLVNYRPEYTHGWGNRSYYTQVRIDPLGAQSAEELLAGLLGDDPSIRPLKSLLIERTDGNPFFMEENVRSLVEIGALAGTRRAYTLVRPAESVSVPATVQAVLAARIDRLPPEEKRLLQTASVIGKDVPAVLLAAVADTTDAELRASLSRLQAAELLYAVNLFPEPEYAFKHALTHEVAYGSLLQERRRALHARIVAAIEALYPDRLDEHVDRLARHAFAGQLWDSAVDYARRAGNRARLRSANREAIAYFEQAIESLRHLPQSHENLEHSIDLRLAMRPAMVPLGEFHRIGALLDDARHIAEDLRDQHRLGRIYAYMTNYFVWMGQIDQAVDVGHRALAIGQSLSDLPIQVVANSLLGNAYGEGGAYRLAIACFRWNMSSVDEQQPSQLFGMTSDPVSEARHRIVWCMAELGQFEEGAALGEAALRIAERLDHPYTLAFTLNGLGRLFLRMGDIARAAATLERGLDFCQTWNFPSIAILIETSLGAAYTLAGRVEEAVRLLEHAVQQSQEIGVLTSQSLQLSYLSHAYLEAGRIAEAIQTSDKAVALGVACQERGHQAWAVSIRGEIAARCDPLAGTEAEAHYRAALALAEDLEMRPLEARCHLGLGKLYRRLGRTDQARTELAMAASMLREMGMTFWLPEAEAELSLATGPGR